MSAKILTPAQATAYKNLNIRTYDTPDGLTGDRLLLCLDGGGIRGILTVQLLKKVEDIAGIPCHQLFDLVAGTSTGAIIAGLIAHGETAEDIDSMYRSLVKNVFVKRDLIADKALNPPQYDKANYRHDLLGIFANATMQQTCQTTNIDLMILARDMTDNEETFFCCFNNNGWQGTYKNALMRTILEATMSAPTYFSSLERFIDGGTTTYNNPSAAAMVEALEFHGRDKYEQDKITIFSFGTGKSVVSVTPGEAAKDKGVWNAFFWLNYVMETTSQDANSMQRDLFRSRIFSHIDYRRYQVSLDPATMKRLPDRVLTPSSITDADTIHGLTDADLNGISLDDTHKFDLMSDIGNAAVDYIMLKNKFCDDLNDTPAPSFNDELSPEFNGVPDIATNVSDPDWIDSQPSK
jgi:hypothetical protein